MVQSRRLDLRDHGTFGVEAQFLQDNDLLISMRHQTRSDAEHGAHDMRRVIENGVED